jgi:hypothetical protein
MAGRPRTRAKRAANGGIAFTSRIADDICALISDGQSLQTISEMPGFPTRRSMRRWLSEHPDFERDYEIARRQRTDNLIDEAIAIADTVDGSDNAAVQKARLQIETRRWLASKLLPERFGDKLVTEVTGKDGTALIPPAEPDLQKLALSMMHLIEGANPRRTIDHTPLPQSNAKLASLLPPPDPEAEARRLAALRTGSPVPAHRPSLGNADEPEWPIGHFPAPQNSPVGEAPRRPPPEDLADWRDKAEAERVHQRIARISRSYP